MKTITLPVAALGLAKTALAFPPICPLDSPLSCKNTTAIENTCCTEVQGQVLQVQFWDTQPATGPADHWTIHGLWPDFCDGSYTQYCDDKREHYNISCILEAAGPIGQSTLAYMEKYWKDQSGGDESFWEHEWNKHGTCYSTLNPSCFTNYQPNEEVVDFFTQTVNLFKTIPTYDILAIQGIVPTTSKNYTSDQVQKALRNARGVNATLECQDGALYEIEYTFSVKGSVADGLFIPAEPVGEGNGCPASFMYLPKNESSVPKVSATTCPALTATLPAQSTHASSTMHTTAKTTSA